MTTPPRYQYASIRTRVEDGQVLVGVKITAKDQVGELVKLPWVEMPAGDARALLAKVALVLDELEQKGKP